jgi:spoIIIJ-associated protein
MSEYKEFSGKDVDEAIREACGHFDTTRDKLEIEILSGGSTGIFGLVGVKKAQVKARVRNEAGAKAETARHKPEPRKPEKPKPQKPKTEKKAESRNKAEPEEQPREENRTEAAEPKPKRKRPNRRSRKNGPKAAQLEEKPESASAESFEKQADKESAPEKKPGPETPAGPPETEAAPKGGKQAQAVPDEEVKQAVLDIVRRLVEPIVPDPDLSVEAEAGLVKVSIEDEENAGLLIGQEGATIQSLQYLANRIAARLVDEELRVHLDAGDYREKQDESLKRMAAHLADKAKSQNKAQSTRPLSSYHRRVVHLTLQDDEGISTRSKGDGPMKRVLILPKKGKGRKKDEQQS